jgi:hypothetical protein
MKILGDIQPQACRRLNYKNQLNNAIVFFRVRYREYIAIRKDTKKAKPSSGKENGFAEV